MAFTWLKTPIKQGKTSPVMGEEQSEHVALLPRCLSCRWHSGAPRLPSVLVCLINLHRLSSSVDGVVGFGEEVKSDQ